MPLTQPSQGVWLMDLKQEIARMGFLLVAKRIQTMSLFVMAWNGGYHLLLLAELS